MPINRTRTIFLIIYFLSTGAHAQSDSNSYHLAMNHLWLRYQDKSITDSTYLRTADSIAATGYTAPQYYSSLQNFRKVAFADKKPSEYKAKYYRHLVIDATYKDLTGRAVYFLQKKVEEDKKLDSNASPELVIARYMIGTYWYYQSYDTARAHYNKVLPYLEMQPAKIKKGHVPGKNVENALTILATSMDVQDKLKDTIALRHAGNLAAGIYAAAIAKVDYNKILPRLKLFYYRTQYRLLRSNPAVPLKQSFLFLDSIETVAQSDDHSVAAVNTLSEVYYFISNEYIAAKMPKEALKYLKLEQSLGVDTSTDAKNHYILLSDIEQLNGNYKLAYEHVCKAYEAELKKTAEIMTDRDNNLYAQAESEDQRELLDEALAQKKASEDRLRFFASISLALVAIAILLPLYLRQRQKAKFLHFKLNMARNLHDETNPALLYAKALARSNRAKEADGSSIKSELERHLDFTMESIRNLSHDLKSDSQHTIADLSKELAQSLKKLGNAHSFSYKIYDRSVARHFISHQQLTQLKAILFECITNSIKHASFNKISITFHEKNRKLHIDYSDNGPGWPDKNKAGIGLDNMNERSNQLNGDLSIRNNYPEGYVITVTLPVRPYEHAII